MLFDNIEEVKPKKEYKVLARKYRPKSFSELIGQDVLVKTISNAIKLNRVPHAFILTGIRGIGKTSSARIIARSLLCSGENGENLNPTINPCGVCENCRAIADDRHIDVIEIDAASNTGVDNVREEIIKSINFSPVLGRYKIFIIDEVHMLSKAAFNALLKTLEEPPSNAKFILATTEIQKVPVTILSRCMRFELSAISAPILSENLAKVASKEGFLLDASASLYLAHLAGGSFRDGLSLLDQAINLANENKEISLESIKKMVGEADEESIIALFEEIVKANSSIALKVYEDMYFKGIEATRLVAGLLELINHLTLVKNNKNLAKEIYFNEDVKNKIIELAKSLSNAFLSKMWQVLMKTLEELKITPSSFNSTQMLIIKMCFVSEMPDFSEIIKKKLVSTEAEPKKDDFSNFNKIVELARVKKEEFLFQILVNTKVINYNFEQKTIQLVKNSVMSENFEKKLKEFLNSSTGFLWQVKISNEDVEDKKSLNQEYKDNFKKRIELAKESEIYKDFVKSFPNAVLIKTVDLSNKEVYQINEN